MVGGSFWVGVSSLVVGLGPKGSPSSPICGRLPPEPADRPPLAVVLCSVLELCLGFLCERVGLVGSPSLLVSGVLGVLEKLADWVRDA